jgi:hypothetical protein
MTEPTDLDLDLNEELKRLTKRLDKLDHDPVVRMTTALYEDRIRKAKAKANMSDRYIASAKEKDPFLKAVTKPIVSDEELR